MSAHLPVCPPRVKATLSFFSLTSGGSKGREGKGGAPQRFACVSVINYDGAEIRGVSSVMQQTKLSGGSGLLQLRPHNNKVRGRISHLTTLNQFHASFIFEWWRITYYILERREKEWL